MKKITLLLVLWLVNYALPFCQVYNSKSSRDTIEYPHKTGQKILAQSVLFNELITDVSMDSLKNLFLINFESEFSSKTGYFGVMNLELDSLLWQQKLNLNKQEVINTNNFLVFSKTDKNYGIDINTGKELWEVDNPLLFTLHDLNIGITYKNKLLKNENPYAVNLTTGKTIWERDDISLKNGLSQHYRYINGQLFIISSEKTNGHDYIYQIDANVGSIQLSQYLHNYNYWGGFYSNSNILNDAEGIIFLTKRHFIKLGYDGHVIFDTEYLIDEFNQKTFLMQNQDGYIVFNLGFIPISNKKLQKALGEVPILARFNPNGSLNYLSKLEHFGRIENFTIDKDTLIVLHRRVITKYNLSNGENSMTLEMKRKDTKEFNNFVGKYCFIEQADGKLKVCKKQIVQSTTLVLMTSLF